MKSSVVLSSAVKWELALYVCVDLILIGHLAEVHFFLAFLGYGPGWLIYLIFFFWNLSLSERIYWFDIPSVLSLKSGKTRVFAGALISLFFVSFSFPSFLLFCLFFVLSLDRSLLSLDFMLEMVFGTRVFSLYFFSFTHTFIQNASIMKLFFMITFSTRYLWVWSD